MKETALAKHWSSSPVYPSVPSVEHRLTEAPTYQLHSGGTSLVSSSRDFSDLYSWQEAHEMCCSKVGTLTRQVSIVSRLPHPDGILGCTHLDEANSHHDEHSLEDRVPGREDVRMTSSESEARANYWSTGALKVHCTPSPEVQACDPSCSGG